MSRRESWDSTTGSKAVSAQAWRFWHEISGATCRLTPDSGCCTRRKVQDSRGWFGKCSHNSFTDTSYEALKERISRHYPVSNNGPFAASHSNGTKQDRHAGVKKNTLGEDKQSKLVGKMSKFFVPLVPVGTGFLSRMAVLSQADDMLEDTWITCESALTDTPELWAPSIGCVTILVSPPTKPIPRPLTPATKWSLELPNLSALIASRLSWNFVSIDAFHRPSDNDPVI